MTDQDNGRFAGTGEKSATLPVNPQIHLSRDPTIDREANRPESIDDAYRVVPCHSVASADWTRVFLTVRENSRERGFSFIRDEPFTEPRAIIGWNEAADRPFILCKLWSCTPLEGGSYRVRLSVDEVIQLKPENVEMMRQSLKERCR
jgi:hypothetical protein